MKKTDHLFVDRNARVVSLYRNSVVRARGGWNGDAHAVHAQQLTRKCTIRVAQTTTEN